MENLSNMTIKRLKGDMKLLKKEPHPYFEAYPETMLEWWFILKGHEISDFTGGYYVGKIIHNKEYPLKPPDFVMYTPNGRFDIEKKICLSNTGYHSTEWSALWNISAILTGFLSIMLEDGDDGISHIHLSKDERADMAKKSVEFNKNNYKSVISKFTRFLDENGYPIKEKTNKETTEEDSTSK